MLHGNKQLFTNDNMLFYNGKFLVIDPAGTIQDGFGNSDLSYIMHKSDIVDLRNVTLREMVPVRKGSGQSGGIFRNPVWMTAGVLVSGVYGIRKGLKSIQGETLLVFDPVGIAAHLIYDHLDNSTENKKDNSHA